MGRDCSLLEWADAACLVRYCYCSFVVARVEVVALMSPCYLCLDLSAVAGPVRVVVGVAFEIEEAAGPAAVAEVRECD